MNAAARSLSTGNVFQHGYQSLSLSRDVLTVILLSVCVLASGLGVVYIKNDHRAVFSELQTTAEITRQLDVEYGQLLLEQSTWDTPVRIQKIAQQKYDMIVPSPEQVVILQPS